MLRISRLPADDGLFRFKVEGLVAREFAGELLRVVTAALHDGRVSLDLSDVTFVDHDGARALRKLEGAGVELVNPSEFVAALLNGDQS